MSSPLSATSTPSTIRAAPPVVPRAGDGSLAAGRASDAAPVPASSAPADNKPNASQAKVAATPAAALSKEQLAHEVQALQAKMDKLNPALAFVVDQHSGRALIQLTDRATKEVIQQFPSEAAIQISKALDRFANGKLVNLTV